MTQVFGLVKETTPYASAPYLDLLTGTFQLIHSSWTTRGPSAEGDFAHSGYGSQFKFKQFAPITETFDLVGQGTPAALRSAKAELEELLEQARRWHGDVYEMQSVWLCVGSEGELRRRALIYHGSTQDLNEKGANPFLSTGQAIETARLRVTICRHPLWEHYGNNGNFALDVSCLGGSTDPTNTGVGVAPGRIEQLKVSGDTTIGTALERFWVGIRRADYGVTSFVPLWECESGTVPADADTALSADGTDATASPGAGANPNKVEVTYDEKVTLLKRLSIKVGDIIASDYDDMAGRYVVLLRGKVSAGTSGIQLRYGTTSAPDATFDRCEEVFLDETSWNLIELGEVEIPPHLRLQLATGSADVQYSELQIWAEEISGTGTVLSLDCLVLIPAEHYVSATGCEILYSAGSDAYVYTLENDTVQGYAEDSSTGAKRLLQDLVVRDWYVPTQDYVAIGAAQRNGVSVIDDIMNYTFYVNYRYLTYNPE